MKQCPKYILETRSRIYVFLLCKSHFLQKFPFYHFHLGIYSFQSIDQLLDCHRSYIILNNLPVLALLVPLVLVAIIMLKFLVVLTSATFAEEPILQPSPVC